MPIETRPGFAGGQCWAGTEPDLAEVLDDPMVHLIMRRDGVSPCQLRMVITVARNGLRSRLCCSVAA